MRGTTEFQPNANITKAQVAQVLYNMEGQSTVIDKSVFAVLKDGVKNLAPQGNASRAQVAAILQRFCEAYSK